MEFGHYWLKRRLVFAFRAQGERLGETRESRPDSSGAPEQQAVHQ